MASYADRLVSKTHAGVNMMRLTNCKGPVRVLALVMLLGTSLLLACNQPGVVAVAPSAQSVGQAEAALPRTGERIYRIVPQQSAASYQAQEKWLRWPAPTKAIATTGDVEGELTLVMGDQPTLAANHFRVDMRTLVSELADTPLSGPAGVFLAQRDHAVRGLLETDKYPFAEFAAASLDGVPTRYAEGQTVKMRLPGDLTVHNVTRPVLLDTEATLGSETLSGTATVQIRMTDFGLKPPANNGSMDVEDDLSLVIRFVARATQVASAQVSLDERHPKLDTPLATLVGIARDAGIDEAIKAAREMQLDVVDGRVRVVVAHGLRQAQPARALVNELGGAVEAEEVSTTGARIPISVIEELAGHPAILALRIPLREE
jgi:hypothetical protein